MDTKRLIVGMLVAMAIVLGWNIFIQQMAKKHNWDLTGAATEPPAQQIQQPAGGDSLATEPATAAAVGGLRVLSTPAEDGRGTELGSAAWKDPVWAMQVQTLSRGAAIGQVTLNEFPRASDRDAGPYVFQEAQVSARASMATLWVRVNGQQVDLSRAEWRLAESSQRSAEYVIEVGTDRPMLRLHKIFELKPRTEDRQSTPQLGYELLVRHAVENLSGQPIQVELGIAGPTLPPRETERGPDRYVMAGYNDDPTYPSPRIKPEAWGVESLTGDKADFEIQKSEKDWPLIWAGLTSTYFDAIVLPVAEKDTHRTANFVRSVRVKGTNAADAANQSAELTFETQALLIRPDGRTQFDLLTYFGPKLRSVLKSNYYASYPRSYDASLTTTGSCAWCTFQWLVDAMVWLLRAFHWVLRDWGLAIIALVVLVRLLLHPLTRKSTIAMHRMQKLAPEIERIKKKYADDPQEQQRAMVAFYREHGTGQLVGCLPMFIQMPIWIALWSSLQSTFELRLAPFLWGFTWIDDLAKPDALIPFREPINILFLHINGINILPILLALVFWLQMKFQPKAASMTPEQAQQQKMMQWMMPLLFPIMLYSGPAGLNLYILTSTAIGILESKIVRDHIKAREAAGPVPVIIEAPATGATRSRKEQEQRAKKPQGRFASFMERVRKAAEEAQRRQQQQQRKNKGKK